MPENGMKKASPVLGCHVSVQGGLYRAFERGVEAGCTGIQIFTRNQRQWRAPPLSPEQIRRFKEAEKAQNGILNVLAHGSYLVNPAADSSRRPDLARLSGDTMFDELNRCEKLGIPFLIVHPGSHGGAGEITGISRIVCFIKRVLHRFEGKSMLLMETTSGQGNSMGCRFEHIRDIMDGVNDRRIGACIDTCHIFSAGYDIRTAVSYRRVLLEFDRIVGLVHVRAIHLNEAQGALGTGIDRHTHIGKGEIGLKAFSLFMRDRRFIHVPKILETPKKLDGRDMDRENIELLRSLL
jgi:deoxyribonuclease-4